MLVCKKCGVEVFGDKRCCPLCQGELAGTPEPEREAFPKTPPPKYDRGMLRKVLNFAAIVSAAVCLAVGVRVYAGEPVDFVGARGDFLRLADDFGGDHLPHPDF